MVALDPVHPREQVVKRFVVFITYLAQVSRPAPSLPKLIALQLYGPLNSLGYIYRSINQNLVDTERLMDLLDEPSEVQDKPDAKELVVTDGVIEFGECFESHEVIAHSDAGDLRQRDVFV
jgi:ABC-type transport system involved in Fe-S cluster assembly fused permease/ATPase subunit